MTAHDKPKHDDKRDKHALEKQLREALTKMPRDVADVVRAAAQKHGLLPGGGPDKG